MSEDREGDRNPRDRGRKRSRSRAPGGLICPLDPESRRAVAPNDRRDGDGDGDGDGMGRNGRRSGIYMKEGLASGTRQRGVASIIPVDVHVARF